MSNHYGAARSNWFKVKNADAFKAALAPISGLGIWEENGYFGVYEDDGDGSGSWPSQVENEETGDYEEFDLFAIIAGHLVEGQVAVFESSGAEKLRYLTGHATAIHSNGERIDIDISDIYARAKEKWSVEPTEAYYGAPPIQEAA